MKMFYPHISGTAVFRRYKHDRIFKLSEQTRISLKQYVECTSGRKISILVSFSRYGNTRYPYILSKLAGGLRRLLPARDA